MCLCGKNILSNRQNQSHHFFWQKLNICITTKQSLLLHLNWIIFFKLKTALKVFKSYETGVSTMLDFSSLYGQMGNSSILAEKFITRNSYCYFVFVKILFAQTAWIVDKSYKSHIQRNSSDLALYVFFPFLLSLLNCWNKTGFRVAWANKIERNAAYYFMELAVTEGS